MSKLGDMMFNEVILPALYEKLGPGMVSTLILQAMIPEEEQSFSVEYSKGLTVIDVRSVYDSENVWRVFIPSNINSKMSMAYGPVKKSEDLSVVFPAKEQVSLIPTLENLMKMLESVVFGLERVKKCKLG